MRRTNPILGDRCLALVFSCVLAVQGLPAGAQEAAPGAAKLNLVIVEGDGAINNIRQRVAREPIVQVEDANHKPIGGAAVTFFLPTQGASGTFANGSRSITMLSDQNGRVIARGIKLSKVTGKMQIRVSASFQGQSASTVITQTNSILAASAGAGAGAGAATAISAKVIVILAVVAASAAAGAAVAVTRGGGSTTSGAGSTPGAPTVIVPGTPSVGGPR